MSEHSKNVWCIVNGQSQNMHSGWYILDRIKFTYITKYLSKRVYREFDKLFQVCRWYLKFYISELECGFCSLICFVVPMYTNMAWNPAEVNYFTLIGNMITVQYIQNVGMFGIHIWRDCEQESESENAVKCIYLNIVIYLKASSIVFALAEI